MTNFEAKALAEVTLSLPSRHRPEVIVLPNGVNEEIKECQYEGRDSNILLFMTHLQGARKFEHRWFMSKVWPIIREKTDMVLWIVGSAPETKFGWMDDERIKVLGFVESLKSLMNSVCP